ncbi:hypothetical protein SDC9_159090 [bioreactor metagenome]|uniref:Uncharacterized protein n=1 Tax=bioreactor metagenome TaxID=1076179 RepID=A0A645FE91_9ZZZZ
MFDGHVQVRNGLSLNALSSVNDQQCSFASGNRTRYFIGEIHVSRSVNQVQGVFLAIMFMFHLNGVALDGDAALPL